MQVQITRSRELQAGYIELSNRKIHRSVEFTDDVIVDLDDFDQVVGIELLELGHVPSLASITDKFHVTSGERSKLELSLRFLMRWKATSGSLTHESQVRTQAEDGRALKSC